jgi:diguanylate cyclase (GGDEF)-like protein/putative nucleotidyltransferase with HDIG domain
VEANPFEVQLRASRADNWRMGGAKREIAELREQLAEAHSRVEELERALRNSRTRDALTGLLRPEALMRRLESEIDRSRRHSRPLTVAVLDVDGMRAINADHGREVGDLVLVAVANALTGSTRANDTVARSGADEFTVMLPETDLAGAAQAVERILLDLEVLRIEGVGSVSVSAGVAQWERSLNGERLIDSAFEQLVAARLRGGGRVQRGGTAAATESNSDVVTALAEALLERDRYTGEHSESVVTLVECVARGLALSDRDVDAIKAAALLHDIGKVAIPDQILNKPAALDDEEWVVMRDHPVIGERILRAIPGMGAIARIVRHEHERFDGSGYPDGLAGEEIPIGARIILACDAYHAMTSDRPYRKAMPHGEAIRELAAGAGTQFDPAVTEILIGALYGRREATGETAASAA